MVFGEWWDQQNKPEEERIAYFRKWPAPPRWLAWLVHVLWDLEPGESEEAFDYQPYFTRLTELGFAGVADYETDLGDEKWVRNG